MKQGICLFLAVLATIASYAQYAPQALVSGTTAIHKSDPSFRAWAKGCTLQRGLQQINDPSLGLASLGTAASAAGFPDGDVVSLGDSGVAVIEFNPAIQNGAGADFAVFENGFPNTADPEEAFLELAFVEVSSDGVHFTRFPAHSLTQNSTQLSSTTAPSYINARQIHNLAGKYLASYGTPFDLSELNGAPDLDIDHITHVRLVDVIGTIGTNASLDVNGNRINDPFPTPFPGSGFDLDAIGVIHMNSTSVHGVTADVFRLFPNPAGPTIQLEITEAANDATAILFDLQGRILKQQNVRTGGNTISLDDLSAGTYFLSVRKNGMLISTKNFVHIEQ